MTTDDNDCDDYKGDYNDNNDNNNNNNYYYYYYQFAGHSRSVRAIRRCNISYANSCDY